LITITVAADAAVIRPFALAEGINLRYSANGNAISISLDETSTQKDVLDIVYVFAQSKGQDEAEIEFDSDLAFTNIPADLIRSSEFLTHPVSIPIMVKAR